MASARVLHQLVQGVTFHQALALIGYPADLAKHIAANAAQISAVDLSEPDEPGALRFVDHLLLVRGLLQKHRTIEAHAISGIDRSYDFLSTDCWRVGFFKALCLAVNSLITPEKSIAVVATIRNEGPFVVEWIAHHQAIGIKDFFIYTNDNSDESTGLLKCLAKADVISLIESDVSNKANPQVKAYEHSLIFNESCRSFSWLVYLDADELLIPSSCYDYEIEKLLAHIPGNSPDRRRPSSVSLNWMWMGSGGHVRWDRDRPLAERFVVGAPTSSFVKSIVDPSAVVSMRGVHKPRLRPDCIGVNSAFREIDMNGHETPFRFEGGEIRHYWNKSFEEFLVKQARGIDRDIWERDTELFFRWDVAGTMGMNRPFPRTLAKRTEKLAERLRGLAGVRDMEARAKNAYAELARRACRGADLDHYFKVSRERFRLSTLLEHPTTRFDDRKSDVDVLRHLDMARSS